MGNRELEEKKDVASDIDLSAMIIHTRSRTDRNVFDSNGVRVAPLYP